MIKNLIWKGFLVVVGVLLVLNLVVTLSPVTKAVPTLQYKVISPGFTMGGSPERVEQLLNQQSAGGWTYVGEAQSVLIFRK